MARSGVPRPLKPASALSPSVCQPQYIALCALHYIAQCGALIVSWYRVIDYHLYSIFDRNVVRPWWNVP